MEYYTSDFSPQKFGLINSQSICYFNSFVQALLSCSSINRHIIDNKTLYSSSSIFAPYVELLEKSLNGKVEDIESVARMKSEFAKRLKETAAKEGNSRHVFGSGQEDAHEGLVFLLEEMGEGIKPLIESRYRQVIKCAGCNNQKYLLSDGDYINSTGNIIHICPDKFDALNKNFSEGLKFHDDIREYTCENCNQRRDSQCLNRLTKLSSVVIIVLKKHQRKVLINAPERFAIKGSSRNFNYRLVACIDHIGGRGGGHYISHVLRKGEWYTINDGRVIKRRFRPSANNYVLFYHIY